MPRRHLAQCGGFGAAARMRIGAAGVEMTARRRVDRARHVALEDDALALARARLRDRHGRQQRLGVGMQRHLEQALLVGHLDDAAEIHDGDAMRDVLDHGEIVRHQQVGELVLVLQVHQQVDDLRLDRDVERRDRLIADDQLRVERQRPGDADALALAARELVRERVHQPLAAGRRDSNRKATRSRRSCGLPTPWITSGSSTIWPADMRGLSEA